MTDDIDVNGAIVDCTETSLELAIKRPEAEPGALPFHDTYQRAGETARHVSFMLEPILFPRPERDASTGASSDYIPQRERLQNDKALAHREQHNRQRVIDNAANQGGSL